MHIYGFAWEESVDFTTCTFCLDTGITGVTASEDLYTVAVHLIALEHLFAGLGGKGCVWGQFRLGGYLRALALLRFLFLLGLLLGGEGSLSGLSGRTILITLITLSGLSALRINILRTIHKVVDFL